MERPRSIGSSARRSLEDGGRAASGRTYGKGGAAMAAGDDATTAATTAAVALGKVFRASLLREAKCCDSSTACGKADWSNSRSDMPRVVEIYRAYFHLPLANIARCGRSALGTEDVLGGVGCDSGTGIAADLAGLGPLGVGGSGSGGFARS